MKIMTYNIRHGLGNDGCVDLERITSIIREQDADIVALQEVDRFWERSGNLDQPEILAHVLGMHVGFGANIVETAAGTRREYGVMTLSRYPLLQWRNIPLPIHDGWEPRGVLVAHLIHPDLGEMRILNTHLQFRAAQPEVEAVDQRRQQSDAIARVFRQSDLPLVVMGDFNAQPDDPELSPLTTELNDAWLTGSNSPSNGSTIPAHACEPATRRIDLIFASPGLRVTECHVAIDARTRIASDHYPVVAEVVMTS